MNSNTTNNPTLVGNKLIAEFMGSVIGNPTSDGKEVYIDVPDFFSSRTTSTHMTEDLKYNVRWDWLMPVVEKIEADLTNVDEFHISYDSVSKQLGQSYYNCYILPARKNTFNKIFFASDSKIEAVYNTVVEFIKWYNTQNKTITL